MVEARRIFGQGYWKGMGAWGSRNVTEAVGVLWQDEDWRRLWRRRSVYSYQRVVCCATCSLIKGGGVEVQRYG